MRREGPSRGGGGPRHYCPHRPVGRSPPVKSDSSRVEQAIRFRERPLECSGRKLDPDVNRKLDGESQAQEKWKHDGIHSWGILVPWGRIRNAILSPCSYLPISSRLPIPLAWIFSHCVFAPSAFSLRMMLRASIRAQASFNDTVRLNTNLLGAESRSTAK